MNVTILSGPNHGFDKSAEVIRQFLSEQDDFNVTHTDDKEILVSDSLESCDVLVFGTGFTRSVRQPDETVQRLPDLTSEMENGLYSFVSSGKGLVGIHGTAWWIGGKAFDLIGGASNWHPPGLSFTVNIDDTEHPATKGLADFEVEDEIYISAHEPTLHVLATAEWHGKAHPMAWVKSFGAGRVFYTTLGHGPGTFARPPMQALVCQGVRWAGTP
jgi:hypothetical protein